MEISSLNKSMNNHSTVHAISTQISSIGAACQKKFKNLTESLKIHSGGSTFFIMPPVGISSQNTLWNNFSPIQMILTSNILIHSA
jgi:hypothetical protein